MPIPIPEALDDHVGLSEQKARSARDLPRYLFSAALAGAYVGVAVVLLVSVSAPFVAAQSAGSKLVQGAVFGVALTLVVFAGAELFTGNAMVMLQGWWCRRVRGPDVLLVLVASLVGNFVGSLGFAAAVHGGGTITGAAADLVAGIVAGKDALSGAELFWRAVLCNALVCLALWMAARTRSDAAKLVVLWWALLAFVASGFEHSVANMTLFSLATLEGTADWGELARNLAWTVPGNVVGGGIVVGVGYAWLARRRVAAAAAAAVPAADGGVHATLAANGDGVAPDGDQAVVARRAQA